MASPGLNVMKISKGDAVRASARERRRARLIKAREKGSGGTAVLRAQAIVLPPIPVRAIHYRKRKRGLDILGSLFFIALFSPLLLLIAALVKITSPGPVFYVSARVGRGGRIFGFLKFRSMYTDADRRLESLKADNEKDGPIFKMKKDPRVTPLGRFLRKYSLDELPQLFNVLKGDMSLVGPRPPIPHEVEQYDAYCRERLSVRPGLTCYWQIMGRSNLSFQEWMELDHRYLREMGLWTDLKILLKTPMAVLRGEGAY
jgi:lipopolysaccharide/colanic/teichoic acid biosynthesis glycosyltransferase